MSAAASPVLSAAKLAGLLVRVPCERARLQAALAKVGPLRLAPDPASPRGLHPIHFELWSVSDGALQYGPLDQHRLAQRLGAAWGQAMGVFMSAALLPWGGARFEPGLPGRVAEWNALAISRATAASLGTYSELIAYVPGVLFGGTDAHGEHSWVVGMMTDSAFARWADGALGFGYRKEPGRFRVDGRGDWEVSSVEGRPMLSVRRQRRATTDVVDVQRVDAVLARPLLGSPGAGRFARSWLLRSLTGPGAHVAPVGVRMTPAPRFMAGLLDGSEEVAPYSPATGWGALEFSGVHSAVTYPRRA